MDPYDTTPPRPQGDSKLPMPVVDGQQSVATPSEPQRNYKKLIIIIGSIVAGLVVAGAAALAVLLYSTSTPEYMLRSALADFSRSKGFAADFVLPVRDGQPLKGEVLAYADPADNQKGYLSFSIGQGEERVGATIQSITDALFIEPAGLGNIGRLLQSHGQDASFLTQQSVDTLQRLDKRWYRLGTADTQSLSAVTGADNLKDTVTVQDIQTLQRLYADHQFLVIEQKLGDEKVNAQNSMHLRLAIDRVRLAEYLQAVRDANLQGVAVAEQDITQARNDSSLDKTKVDVWIGRDSKTFQQFRLVSDNQDGITLTLHPEQIAIHQTTITKPADAAPFAELMEGVLTLLFSAALRTSNTP